MLETQFQTCDDALNDALGRIRDEADTYYDRSMLKLATALARVTTQMATAIGRLEEQQRGAARFERSQNRSSNT